MAQTLPRPPHDQDKKYIEPTALKVLRFLTTTLGAPVAIGLVAWFLPQLIPVLIARTSAL